jgi:hypothetical protein
MALSPWAVRHVRFDEALRLGHGYDFDYCQQLRAAGKRLMTADLRAVRHHPLELVEEIDVWVEAHMQAAEKWDGKIPGREPDGREWKERARRAEAEREAARTVVYSTASSLDARAAPLEKELEELEKSLSWRLTAPLRRLNKRRRDRRA